MSPLASEHRGQHCAAAINRNLPNAGIGPDQALEIFRGGHWGSVDRHDHVSDLESVASRDGPFLYGRDRYSLGGEILLQFFRDGRPKC